MTRTLVMLAVVLGLSLAGCARKVVIDPEAVKQMNSPDWTVKSAPRKAAAVAPPAAAAPASAAAEATRADATKAVKPATK